MELYLNTEEQKTRRIAFAHCEDEACGFLVEFKHPNCTFFICKEHKGVINADLNGIPAAGISCELHGPMERYDILKEDNLCPVCKKSMLAIVSVGKNPTEEVKSKASFSDGELDHAVRNIDIENLRAQGEMDKKFRGE